ncbi:cation diffusion facilitator family transporter [Alicyclobacillus mali (ex Roth et al. 2021)]|uniref:cation diffusion facilitator family transporter n=1 Tax=Alicyclobacillus mali (ex Roth et al. 2021) TaxID=1123961 RepID=UPI001A8E3219|nr:cation diffusion facilitator family transporter [Alicyclobacillus mali (ex Roth et al. 2021)]
MSMHSHDHRHDHSDAFHSHVAVEKMKIAFFLTLIILVIEALGGWISHSLALWSDAGHVLSDLAAIGLSWYAMKQSQKPANEGMTFGYYRAGILAAFVNGVTLILITLWILREAYGRFQHPEHVTPTWMFLSAGVGLVMNLYLGLGMRHEENINVQSAVLHMLGDAAASAGVIMGGIIIAFTRWYVIDPILSVLIALLIAFGAWRIVRQTVNVLMEGTPVGIEIPQVVDAILSVKGIQQVHDLHVWTITSGRNALSCHVVVDGKMTVQETQNILRDVEHKLIHLGIRHVTIQPEDAAHPHGDSILCKNDAIHDNHDDH